MDTKTAAAASKSNILEESANNKGRFTREIPDAGIALLRFRDYLELGFHKNPKNPSWTPAIDCVFAFELVHPRHMITPQDKPAFPQLLTVHVPKATKSGSLYMSLFNAMNTASGGTHEHFGTMLGNAYLAKIFHNKVGDKTYANLNNTDKVWSVKPPQLVSMDELTMEETVKQIPVPEMFGEARLFLWEEAGWSDELLEEAWNSIYIEGERDDGQSNNWMQDSIMTSETYTGSRIESVANNGTMKLPDALTGDLDAQGANQAAPEQKEAPVKTAEEQALAALGL